MMSHELSSYTRNWELTPYEMQRTRQELIAEDCETGVSAKCVQSELTCPICLDILRQTMTTKECLHRFCHFCITTALRSGNKECPTCRKKLVSKRSLRPDPNFDSLIEKLFPNRKEFDTFQEKVLKKMSKSKHASSLLSKDSTAVNVEAGNDSFGEPVTDLSEMNVHDHEISNDLNLLDSSSFQGLEESVHSYHDLNDSLNLEESVSNVDEEKNVNSSDMKVSKAYTELAISNTKKLKRRSGKDMNLRQLQRKRRKEGIVFDERSKNAENESECDFELVCQPHPDEKSYEFVRYIKTFCRAYVKHLSAYLRLRCEMLEYDSTYNVGRLNRCFSEQSDYFQLFVYVNNEYTLLKSDMNLLEIMNRYNPQGSLPLDLFYKRNS